jgi:hypothetical protein
MIPGFYDAREVADILDWRASSVRELAEQRHPMLPVAIYLPPRLDFPLWPEAAIECWVKQGCPNHFNYDVVTFTEIAVDRANRSAAESIKVEG